MLLVTGTAASRGPVLTGEAMLVVGMQRLMNSSLAVGREFLWWFAFVADTL